MSSAKLDATGHRGLASLGICNFQLNYKRGKANGDADGLSRKPQQTVQLYPSAVNAICKAYTVQRNACPYVRNFIVSQDWHVVESLLSDSQDVPPVSSEFQDINWSREQLANPNISRV